MTNDWLIAGWPIVRIRDIGRLHGGGTPSRKRPEFFSGTIPWITGQDIPESHVAEISTARDYVTDEAVQESATRVAPAGSVLVTTRVSVGKTAVAGCPICFSQDVTAILIHSLAIALPHYVAHFLRSRREALFQKNQGSTILGITRDSLALEQIPLPPLSEQQRIVEILQEAEEIRRLRAEAEGKTVELIPAVFAALFGPEKMKSFKTQKISDLCDLVRGSSPRPQGDPLFYGLGVPRLMVQDLTRDGWFVTPQIDSLTELGATKSRLMNAGEVVMAVSGAPGLSAILRVDCCIHDGFVGFRNLNQRLQPIFFVGWLQQQRLRLEREAVGAIFRNLATPQIKEWRVPLPPLPLQDKFSLMVQEISEISNSLKSLLASRLQAQLVSSLSAYAFSGQLTADWREANKDRLAIEAHERDAALKQAGASFPMMRSTMAEEIEALLQDYTEGIYAELNREQRFLLREIKRMVGGVPYARYFTAQLLSDYLSQGPLRRNPHAIEGHLSVLAARGLIIPVSREEQTEDTGEFVFGNAYRLPLRDEKLFLESEEGDQIVTEDGEEIVVEQGVGDHTRLHELERLAVQLEKERALT
jgi:restriction endonuclease S subunit